VTSETDASSSAQALSDGSCWPTVSSWPDSAQRCPPKPFFRGLQTGDLGQVSQGKDSVASGLDDDTLVRSTIIHGSLATLARASRKTISPLSCCKLQQAVCSGTGAISVCIQPFRSEAAPADEARAQGVRKRATNRSASMLEFRVPRTRRLGEDRLPFANQSSWPSAWPRIHQQRPVPCSA
jgi:hypothetical protein